MPRNWRTMEDLVKLSQNPDRIQRFLENFDYLVFYAQAYIHNKLTHVSREEAVRKYAEGDYITLSIFDGPFHESVYAICCQ